VVHVVPAGETLQLSAAMLPQAGDKCRRDADVQRAIWLARQYINAGLFLHRQDDARGWMLKQVQHDGKLAMTAEGD
jgi:hypothetical protein